KVKQSCEEEGRRPLYSRLLKRVKLAETAKEIGESIRKYPSLAFLNTGAPLERVDSSACKGFKPLASSFKRSLLHLMSYARVGEEMYEKVTGMKILDKGNYTFQTSDGYVHPMQCDSYLFHQESWYDTYLSEALKNKNIRF